MLLELLSDLVKIDVEGAESFVLYGAKKLAKIVNPFFFVEMHATKEIPMLVNSQKVLDWWLEMGYYSWYMKEEKVLRDATEIASRGRCHLLLVPKGKDYPNYLKGIAQGAQLPLINS